ncbi:MAG: hypothetical protein K6G71_06005 [Clostridiales bacterium]|nr:hypothetical protein [Clostridiales bacterium]
MKKRVLTVILCAALLLGAVIVPAYAADRPVYVVLGDSIAFGSGLLNPREAVYGRIVADTDGYEYYNYAVPGHTTGNLLRRMGEETVKEAIVKADIINISIGGNNFLLGNLNGLMYDWIVKKDYSRFDAIAEGVYKDIGTVVDTIRELNPDAAIILQTLYNPQTGYVGEVYMQGRDRINAAIRAFDEARPGEIIVADVGAVLTDSGSDFAEDRIHPSASGNEKIARVILETLYENGLGTETEPVIAVKGIDAHGAGVFTVFVNFYGLIFHILSVVRNMFSGNR